MSSAHDELLRDRAALFVKQRKEWTGILVDWETRNQYALLDDQGVELGVIVEKAGGVGSFLRRASIAKKWGGGLREVFADADTFRVGFETGNWNATERAVVLAAAISVDFDFFENDQGPAGLLDLLPG